MSFIHRAAITCRLPSERTALFCKTREVSSSVYHCQLPHDCCFLTVTQTSTFPIFSFGSISIQRAIATLQTTIWCRDLSKLEIITPEYESAQTWTHDAQQRIIYPTSKKRKLPMVSLVLLQQDFYQYPSYLI